ncbi:hypothetical protein ACI79C_16705 [Geodermatophilus sp. SYSU D00697]
MTSEGTARAESARAVPAPSPPSPPTPLRAATRALAGVRRVPVARVLTAGPVLRASAYAVAAAVVGRVVRSLTGPGRPVRPVRTPPVARRPPPSAGGAEFRVTTWTAVEVRWRVD